MKQLRRFVILVLVGSLAFWLPDILLHVVISPFSRLVPLCNTVVCTLCFYWVIRHWAADWARSKWLAALAMCVGVWLLGPLMLSFSFWISVGNFAGRDPAWYALFPFTVLTGSRYDGTLFAVILVTLYASVLAIGAAASFLWRRTRHKAMSSAQMTQ